MPADAAASPCPPRIAWAMSGRLGDPTVFSGLPASISGGFDDSGLPLVAIDAQLPATAQRLLQNLMTVGFLDAGAALRGLRAGRSPRLVFRDNKPKLLPSREMAAIRSFTVARRMRAAAPLDGAVQWGCEFALPPGVPYVTLDDATIQALRTAWDYEWMAVVPERTLNRMIARQRRIYRRARACCVMSHWAARSAIEDYGVAPERVTVVGCGANRRPRPVRRDYSTPRFLFVGKQFERKNGPALLRAFAALRERHPDATLDVVGEHPRLSEPGVTGHGPLGLGDPDHVRAVDALFERATCFAMPSRFEPCGMVFAEALAAGIGAIGTTHGGSPTVIGDAGVTVDPDDPGQLVAALRRCAEPEQAGQLADRARARAPLFTWRAVAERILGALELAPAGATELAAAL